jgi:hypothetical protein
MPAVLLLSQFVLLQGFLALMHTVAAQELGIDLESRTKEKSCDLLQESTMQEVEADLGNQAFFCVTRLNTMLIASGELKYFQMSKPGDSRLHRSPPTCILMMACRSAREDIMGFR